MQIYITFTSTTVAISMLVSSTIYGDTSFNGGSYGNNDVTAASGNVVRSFDNGVSVSAGTTLVSPVSKFYPSMPEVRGGVNYNTGSTSYGTTITAPTSGSSYPSVNVGIGHSW